MEICSIANCLYLLNDVRVNSFNVYYSSLKGNPIENSDGKKELERLCSYPGRCTIRYVQQDYEFIVTM